MKGPVVHQFWEGVTHGEGDRPWFFSWSVDPSVVHKFSVVLPELRFEVLHLAPDLVHEYNPFFHHELVLLPIRTRFTSTESSKTLLK